MSGKNCSRKILRVRGKRPLLGGPGVSNDEDPQHQCASCRYGYPWASTHGCFLLGSDAGLMLISGTRRQAVHLPPEGPSPRGHTLLPRANTGVTNRASHSTPEPSLRFQVTSSTSHTGLNGASVVIGSWRVPAEPGTAPRLPRCPAAPGACAAARAGSRPDPSWILSTRPGTVFRIPAVFAESCHFFTPRRAAASILVASSPPACGRRWRNGAGVESPAPGLRPRSGARGRPGGVWPAPPAAAADADMGSARCSA